MQKITATQLTLKNGTQQKFIIDTKPSIKYRIGTTTILLQHRNVC